MTAHTACPERYARENPCCFIRPMQQRGGISETECVEIYDDCGRCLTGERSAEDIVQETIFLWTVTEIRYFSRMTNGHRKSRQTRRPPRPWRKWGELRISLHQCMLIDRPTLPVMPTCSERETSLLPGLTCRTCGNRLLQDEIWSFFDCNICQ